MEQLAEHGSAGETRWVSKVGVLANFCQSRILQLTRLEPRAAVAVELAAVLLQDGQLLTAIRQFASDNVHPSEK
jgi:hypothetical protein